MATLTLNTLARRRFGTGLLGSLLALDAGLRQADALRKLDREQLADVGLSRTQALKAAGGPAWNAPLHWQR